MLTARTASRCPEGYASRLLMPDGRKIPREKATLTEYEMPPPATRRFRRMMPQRLLFQIANRAARRGSRPAAG